LRKGQDKRTELRSMAGAPLVGDKRKKIGFTYYLIHRNGPEGGFCDFLIDLTDGKSLSETN